MSTLATGVVVVCVLLLVPYLIGLLMSDESSFGFTWGLGLLAVFCLVVACIIFYGVGSLVELLQTLLSGTRGMK